ncbi:membrane protein insertion efficiency factor YidD [Tautonia plasticadhaerens]|uniref:Putative membrane protein insertion efficiency factor n=1 Tax=Tautonia plasticadhaerens TaxID=2527974 RepID=A0A518H6T6_9BACT|nr:membrane protein insertion efficiency factor YidD [Tautonia plasticadhaerens]QDV36580.1 Putative membrane protein insertion efficiency factor [Tautonia plasticadhaerens]
MTVRPWRWPGLVAVEGLCLLIRGYQILIAPLIGDVCRFEPSCSRYMVGALRKYGFFRGFWKGTGRLLRCHPWHLGGYDPP